MTSFVNPDYFRSLRKIHFVINNFFLLIQNEVGDPLNTPPPPSLTNEHNSVEIVYISYKSFLYSLDKFAVKIDQGISFPYTHVRLTISSSWFCLFFFGKSPRESYRCMRQIDEDNHFVTGSPHIRLEYE